MADAEAEAANGHATPASRKSTSTNGKTSPSTAASSQRPSQNGTAGADADQDASAGSAETPAMVARRLGTEAYKKGDYAVAFRVCCWITVGNHCRGACWCCMRRHRCTWLARTDMGDKGAVRRIHPLQHHTVTDSMDITDLLDIE